MAACRPDILAQHNHSQREAAKAIEQSFEKAATSRNLSHEWRHKALNDTEVLGDIIIRRALPIWSSPALMINRIR